MLHKINTQTIVSYEYGVLWDYSIKATNNTTNDYAVVQGQNTLASGIASLCEVLKQKLLGKKHNYADTN